MPLRFTFNGVPWEVSDFGIDLQSLSIDMGNTLTVKFGANLLAVSAHPPVAPSGFTAFEVSATGVELRWTRSNNKEAQYDLYSSADGVTYSLIGTVANNVASFLHQTDATTAGYYQIIARNHFGESDPSILHYLPILPPTGLNLTVVSGTEISITFTDNNNNGLGFVAERSTDGGGSWTPLATFAASPLDDTGLSVDTNYTYRIAAIGPNWNSYWSDLVSGTTGSGTAPNAPSLLLATAIDHQRIDLGWQDNSSDESGFEIERSLDGATGWALVGTVSAGIVAYSDIHLLASTTYYYRVRAINGALKSGYSNTANATTPSDPNTTPNDPTGLTAQANGSTQISLAWTDNSNNETGFEIERRSPAGTGSFALIATTAAQATTYADTGLTPSTEYEYRVRAINGALASGYTNLASATTPAGDAFGLTVTSAHPRIWFNSAANQSQLQTWWATHSFVPGSDLYDLGLAYYVTGNATYLTNAKNILNTWFLNWAYQGTANQTGFVAVGPYSGGLAPGITASDTYRWGESQVPCLDWIWNGLTAQEKDKYMNGYTTTWVGGVHDGQTVTVPGYTTLALVNMSRTWGGLTMPESNYFWGCFRNEIQYALLIYYEDPTTAATLLTFCLSATNSRWAAAKAAFNSGKMQSGLSIEGSGYGATVWQYPLIVIESMKNYGRDLMAETTWWKDALDHLIYGLSPQTTPSSDGGTPFYSSYPWADMENDNGYQRAASIYTVALAMYLSRYHGEAVTGKYARKWQSLIGGTLAKYYQALDTGGTSVDWRTQGLAKYKRYSGTNWYVRRNGWDGNETVWQIIGSEATAHGHDDAGSFQIYRKNRWLTKESTGYAIQLARYGFNTTIAASPAPTTTQFKLNGLPTTLTYWGVTAPIKFITGFFAGQTAIGASVDPTTGVVTLSAALSQAPAAGDQVSYQMANVSSKVSGSGYSGVAPHNGVTIGMAGFASAGYRLSTAGVVNRFLNEYVGYCALAYDLTAVYRGAAGTGGASAKPDYTTNYVREFYILDSLETMVVLDRIAAKTFGNSSFAQWADTALPTHWHLHTHHQPALDSANTLLHTWDTQCLRVFTLLPASPLRYVNSLTDFTGTHTGAGWYQYRTEIQDSGSAQRYFLHVLQARDSTEADVTAAITAEDAGTWTVTITHATKGNATLTLNKGMTASEGSVVLS